MAQLELQERLKQAAQMVTLKAEKQASTDVAALNGDRVAPASYAALAQL